MFTTDFKNNIIPYIGETVPYVFVPEKVILSNDYKTETEIINFDVKDKNFTNLIKVLSSLGSCNLYKLLNDDSKEKIYFLGEKLRIRKLSYKESDSFLISCKSFLESKRKGKSYLNVKDLDSKEMLYTFELDYYIFSKDAFENIYKDYFNNTAIEFYDENLPSSRINIENNKRFSIFVNPFTANQCKGHFENFAVVPAVFITNCILKEIFIFSGNELVHEVDSLEMYLTKAMPIGKEMIVYVSHQKFLKEVTNFKCEVKDMSGNIYGTYIINIKTKLQ